jgi:uracil phosphoribosyltransferase
MSELPANVHVSKHPCLRAKLSQLRSKSTNARETKDLVHEISLILGIEALAGLEVVSAGNVRGLIAGSDDLLIFAPRMRLR